MILPAAQLQPPPRTNTNARPYILAPILFDFYSSDTLLRLRGQSLYWSALPIKHPIKPNRWVLFMQLKLNPSPCVIPPLGHNMSNLSKNSYQPFWALQTIVRGRAYSQENKGIAHNCLTSTIYGLYSNFNCHFYSFPAITITFRKESSCKYLTYINCLLFLVFRL